MKCFITGGTGTVGSYLIPELLAQGHEITLVTRNTSHIPSDWNVTTVEGDLTELGIWSEAVIGQDAIINLAGENIFAKRWTAKRKAQLYNSRITSTENLVSAIQSASAPPQVVVSISGIDYYPFSNDLHVETDPSGTGFLSKLSKDWERPLEKLETRVVLLRSAVMFTQTGKSAERMFLPHRLFIGGSIGNGKQFFPWVHVKDVVKAIIWCLTNTSTEGIYNIVASDVRTFKETAQIGGKILGRWTWTVVPAFALKLVLGERAQLLLGSRRVSNKKLKAAGFSFDYPTLELALNDILGKKR